MPEVLTDGLRFGKPLGDDVTGSGKGLLNRTDLIPDIFPGLCLRVSHLNLPHLVSQRLQAFLLRHRGTGSPLRSVRQIQILQLTGHHTILNFGAQLVRKLSLLGDRGQYALLPLLHLREHIVPVLDLGDGYIIQPSGLLLPVTADERNRVALLEKMYAVLDLPILDSDGTGNIINIDILHIQSVIN